MRNRREVEPCSTPEPLHREKQKFILFLLSLLTAFLLTTQTRALSDQDLSSVNTVIALTGDVMLGRAVNRSILNEKDPTWPFAKVADVLKTADISLINLETPVLEKCPTKEFVMVFCTPKENVAGLQFAGIDVANLANNHRLDQWEAGYESTLTLLDEAGIRASDEEHVVVIEKNGIRFGFIGFNLIKQSDLMTIKSKASILTKVSSVKRTVDVLIVSMHWGNEYQKQPPEVIVKYAHDVVDAGADVIAGNHPHVIQRFEAYHEGIIFYSLGNLVFDQEPLETRSGEIIQLTFKGKDRSALKVIPTLIEHGGQPRLVN